ncbi:uncharacterized protein LOC125656339 [Ostrea edulis]|uniref:uncharacterized protein LOC125656339 n=1 Tax=Ostrea edulis TaxID=37623 RepID=UPI0024AF6C42|nr:uncharacterized protein LOC125656339 [Ostrea edulis]
MARGAWCVCLLGLTAVLASPVKRNEGGDYGAVTPSREQMEEAFKHIPKETIRKMGREMNENIKDAVEMTERMRQIEEPIRQDWTLDPELMKESGFLMEDSAEISEVFNTLPALDVKDMHFLQTCIARGKETDFDNITDKRDLLNEVLRQVFDCSAIGLSLLETETNLDGLTDEELTPAEVINRIEKVQQISFEFLHLGGFVFKFSRRVEKDFGKISNNELVHGNYEGSKESKSGQVTGSPIEASIPKGNDKATEAQGDSGFDKTVRELKRLLSNRNLKTMEDKRVEEKSDEKEDKSTNENDSENARGKPRQDKDRKGPAGNSKGPSADRSNKEDDTKTEDTGKMELLKKQLGKLLGLTNEDEKASVDERENVASKNGKKTEVPQIGGGAGGKKPTSGSDDVKKRELVDLLRVLAERREILKREHVRD